LILIIAIFPQNDLRTVLGIVFVIVFPGYSLVSATFPRKGDLSGVERLALTLGLSIAIVSLIGLIYNYAPWGITLNPMLYSLFGFNLLVSAIAWYRRRRLPPAERFCIEFSPRLPLHSDGTGFSRVLSRRRW
ncbi:MAG: DUF1616 domain-containing protein, partial [Chloroflexi bacterium]|nr:DUF1616 domain-containing protein [Chloroflexota bacterium]